MSYKKFSAIRLPFVAITRGNEVEITMTARGEVIFPNAWPSGSCHVQLQECLAFYGVAMQGLDALNGSFSLAVGLKDNGIPYVETRGVVPGHIVLHNHGTLYDDDDHQIQSAYTPVVDTLVPGRRFCVPAARHNHLRLLGLDKGATWLRLLESQSAPELVIVFQRQDSRQ